MHSGKSLAQSPGNRDLQIAEPGKTGQRGTGVRILSVAMACWKKLPLRGVVFRSPPESEDFGEDNRRSSLPPPPANAGRQKNISGRVPLPERRRDFRKEISARARWSYHRLRSFPPDESQLARFFVSGNERPKKIGRDAAATTAHAWNSPSDGFAEQVLLTENRRQFWRQVQRQCGFAMEKGWFV